MRHKRGSNDGLQYQCTRSIASALTEKLLTYATGARVQFADRDDIAAIVKSLRSENYGLRSLIHRLVDSRPFLNK